VWYKPWTWGAPTVATTTVDSAWDDEQLEIMQGFAAYEADLHGPCGHLLSESTDILADPMNAAGEWKYKPQLPIRCHACTALAPMIKEYDNDTSLLWVVDKIPREPRG